MARDASLSNQYFSETWYLYAASTNLGRTAAILWDYNKQPSFTMALHDLFSVNISTDCANFGRVMRLIVTYSAVGERGISKLILKHSEDRTPFQLMHYLSWYFFTQTSDISQNGIYAYPYVNIREYTQFKSGVAANHNVIRLPNNQYLGFDPDFFYKLRTELEIEKYMFEQFIDKEDIIPGMESKHASFIANINFKLFQDQRFKYQQEVGYFIFDQKRADDFLKSL